MIMAFVGFEESQEVRQLAESLTFKRCKGTHRFLHSGR
ncbi:hypothetical protein S100141_02841 [Bacillus licheniformis]|nr:hypothetical protein S100141_02841 [Bacillus licheniformis]